MKKKKVIIGIILIAIITAIIIFVIQLNKQSNQSDPNNNTAEVGNEEHEEERTLVGGIENEEYYFQAETDYMEISEEYDEMMYAHIENSFTEEQKNEIKRYQDSITEASKSGDKEKMQQLSQEYVSKIEEYSKQQLTEQQLKEVEKKKKEMEELEVIVDKYQELKVTEMERRYNEGIETLEDGTIVNKRKEVTEDEEFNGYKFTNISLTYSPETKNTTIKTTVTNISGEDKKEKMITIHITGDVESKIPIQMISLLKNEYYEIELPISVDLSRAGALEFIEFEESDFQ